MEKRKNLPKMLQGAAMFKVFKGDLYVLLYFHEAFFSAWIASTANLFLIFSE